MRLTRRARWAASVGFVVVASTVGVAAAAWACTAVTSLAVGSVVSPDGTARAVPAASTATMEPGSTVVLQARNGAAMTSIHWNSVDGPLLATVATPEFDVSVNVPADAMPGVHYLVAVGRDASGAVVRKATVPLAVTSATRPVAASASRAWDAGVNPAAYASDGKLGPETALGAALLSVGLVVLSGFALVLARKRPVLVAPPRQH